METDSALSSPAILLLDPDDAKLQVRGSKFRRPPVAVDISVDSGKEERKFNQPSVLAQPQGVR